MHGVRGRRPHLRRARRADLPRLHLVPRYRQRLAFVPFNQGRPVWVDDPHFNVAFHVRHTALPSPGGDAQLKRLTGRVFSQALDRSRPLWEIWLVEGLVRRPLRDALQDPSRARRRRLRRRHLHGPVRHLPRADAGGPARSRVGRAAVAQRRPAARRCAARARHRAGRDRPRGQGHSARASPRRPAGRTSGRRRRGHGPGGPQGGAAQSVQRAHRPSPPVHLGARRPAGVQGDQERAGRHRQRRGAGRGRGRAGPLPAHARRGHRRARAARHGPDLGPRRRRAGRAGQPCGRDVGATADRGQRSRPAPADDQPRRWTGSRSPGRRWARRC